ncbi:MAG: segregation/condensation protein A, partial [Planctomycetes bacterium]|nr:segregation/condensation protein A [Planctomycetota bacterium]
SRMLLPTPPPDEQDQQDYLGDPRAELVRQLLQYKTFRDAAATLAVAAAEQALRHPRKPALPQLEQNQLELDNVQIWDLLDAFNKLMAAIGKNISALEVIHDETPIALHAEDICDRLERDGSLTFREIFAGREERSEIVGLFLALLELIHQGRVATQQQGRFGEIYVSRIHPGGNTVLTANTENTETETKTKNVQEGHQPSPDNSS